MTLAVDAFGALVQRGMASLCAGDFPKARRHSIEALAIRPEDAGARHLLARSLAALGELERALVIYEGLLVDVPQSALVKVSLAVVLLKLGRASAARSLLETVVRKTPAHTLAWGYLGVALEQLGLLTEAEAAFVSGGHARAARRVSYRQVACARSRSRVHWGALAADSAVHATESILVRLLEGPGSADGLVVSTRLLDACAVRLRRLSLPDVAAAGFVYDAFEHVTGAGSVVLSSLDGARLLPVTVDSEVAVMRADLVAAFDCALLRGAEVLEHVRRPFLRFRGTGTVLLGLRSQLVPVYLRGPDPITFCGAVVVGWIGSVDVDAADVPDTLAFGGEGALLLARAGSQG